MTGPATATPGVTAVTFERALSEITSAIDPEALFGPRPGGRAGVSGARAYRRLAAAVHPDRVEPSRRREATEAFSRLGELWRRWREPWKPRTRRGEFQIGGHAYSGDLATLYQVEPSGDLGESILLKVPRSPGNNDLLQRESLALARIAAVGDPRHLPYVPALVDAVRHRDPGTGVQRRLNLLATAADLHSVAEVRAAYPGGLDPRDAAWMWRRLLVALGLAHRAGVVHGAVVPDHVLIQPERHGLVLADWCYSVIVDGAGAVGRTDRVPALVPRYAEWYPEEIPARRPVGPGTDIAMATGCVVWLMAGERWAIAPGEPLAEAASRALALAGTPAPLARFATGCLLQRLSQRPDDAWRLLAELDTVLERCFGPRRFRPFTLTTPHDPND